MIHIVTYIDDYKERTVHFILSILEDEFGYENRERTDLFNIPKVYQQDSKGNFWLGISDNEIIGTIAIQNYGNDRGFLRRMYVKKELRKKGIGQELFNTLLKFAINSGYRKIYTSTVKEFISARNFYQKNGFVEIKKLPKELATPLDNVFFELTI